MVEPPRAAARLYDRPLLRPGYVPRAPVVWSLRLRSTMSDVPGRARDATYAVTIPPRVSADSASSALAVARRAAPPRAGAPSRDTAHRPAGSSGSGRRVSAEIRSTRVRGYLVDSLQF